MRLPYCEEEIRPAYRWGRRGRNPSGQAGSQHGLAGGEGDPENFPSPVLVSETEPKGDRQETGATNCLTSPQSREKPSIYFKSLSVRVGIEAATMLEIEAGNEEGKRILQWTDVSIQRRFSSSCFPAKNQILLFTTSPGWKLLSLCLECFPSFLSLTNFYLSLQTLCSRKL